MHHDMETRPLPGNAELVVHGLGEYQLVEVFIPADSSNVTVHDLRVKGVAVEAYRELSTPNTIAVVGGGFFGYDDQGKESPIGLTREDNVRKVSLMPWSHGGVLASDGKGTIRIFPAESAKQGGRWAYALQSKPIIILNGSVDVAKNPRDADYNRVAVGTTPNGDILIVGLFHGFGQAATLVSFSKLYKQVSERRGLKILRALAMDGGAGAQIFVPQVDMSFGDTGLSYFPNAVRFDSKLGKNTKQ
ncbi:phosphodiester glycosidase family protein [Pseudomonas sp. DP-17]|uniref:phosphodiester glycosidase family protein n=1 Tax=Pseudomonas sp. DP-17 TaxID=1580486 RepID=UPI001EFA93BD|nr:phosphodiester glycosidase family protein [Pseudomonas sp. DP-17]MCG8910283.1 phosphodiester glycosidase family protein [Pseudomonas sp. DP-17]